MTAEVAVQDRFVSLGGLRFHYRAWGRPAALVLLHALMGHADTWDRFAGEMADRLHVLALDQRGHGQTDWATDYHAQRLDDDLRAFLEQVAGRQPALAGHSMGGVTGYLYAARHPGMVGRLGIVDIGPDLIVREGEAMAARLRTQAEQSFADPEEAVQQRAALVPRVGVAYLRRTVGANLVQRADGRWVWRCDAARLGQWGASLPAEAAHWALLGQIGCPTLLVRGAESPTLSRSTAARMAQTIPDCRLVEIPESGHGPQAENPVVFLTALRPFLLGEPAPV